MAARLFLFLFLFLVVFFDASGRKENGSFKERCRTIYDPSGILKILVLYIVLGLIGDREKLIAKSISFFFCFAIVSFLVFSLMSAFVGRLRKTYEAKTIFSLWLLPNLMYFNFYWASATPVFRPFFVLCIDHDDLLHIILVVWLAVASLILLWDIASHLRFRRKLDESLYELRDERILAMWNKKQDDLGIKENKRIRVFTSPAVSSAMSVGVLQRNCILVLPEKEYSDAELDMIFSHELVHIIRADGVTKLYMAICRAFNFYDPFVYSMSKKCSEDIELACDEIVLSNVDGKTRKDYGKLVLSSAGEEKGFTSNLSASGESMKYRLMNILKPEEKRKGTVLLSVCALIVLFIPDLIGVAYHSQNMKELFFKGNIKEETVEIRSREFGVPNDPYEDPDKEAIFSYLSSLDAYEIYASQNFDGRSVCISYAMDDVSRSVEFNRYYIVFKDQKNVRTYYVKEGIDMDLMKKMCQ